MSEFDMSGIAQKSVPPPLPESHNKPLSPVMVGERVLSMDVVRGFALLGILISNMLFFSQPLGINGWRGDLWFSATDKLTDWISMIFIEGKFYPIFSMLFGMGVAMQMGRASSRGIDFKTVYLRRLYILMGFGVLHGILLWEGDVLLVYAICGLVLLMFRDRKPRTLLFWSAGFILFPSLLILLIGTVLYLLSAHPEVQAFMTEAYAGDEELRGEILRIFTTGSYMDVVFYRLGEMVFILIITLVYAPVYLGLFLIGMWAGREGTLQDIQKYTQLFVRIFLICGGVGLMANLLGAWLQMIGIEESNYGLMLIGSGILSIFGPVLSCAYIAGLVLLMHRWPLADFFALIASVGRMALTNYLAQSLIATTIFYGYGFGLGGNVGRMGTIGIALLIFAGQILFSVCWLKFYRYGPMEWLWRSLTYGKRQAMALEK